ncbi:hypothetical protein [Alteromonas stellipolaris]|uniref:Superinfection immunity protein n=1 Tax=Alteromonas stellipolaris TaxID=233316 RepID=A0ABN4LRQ8_9ALTE|nr:hypothetical protein AVL57_00730 [Alteromonas stellipolaris]
MDYISIDMGFVWLFTLAVAIIPAVLGAFLARKDGRRAFLFTLTIFLLGMVTWIGGWLLLILKRNSKENIELNSLNIQ